mgnify:CR=1 FL=1
MHYTPNCSQASKFIAAEVHELGSIGLVAKCMKRELDARIKVIADKITGGLNLEKRAWASLHEVEEEVSKMMAEVDKDVQEAVSITITMAEP